MVILPKENKEWRKLEAIMYVCTSQTVKFAQLYFFVVLLCYFQYTNYVFMFCYSSIAFFLILQPFYCEGNICYTTPIVCCIMKTLYKKGNIRMILVNYAA